MTSSLPIPAAVCSPELLRAALQASRVPMVLADPPPPHHPTVFCNRAFCDLTGYAEAEVIGRDLRFLQGRRSDPAAAIPPPWRRSETASRGWTRCGWRCGTTARTARRSGTS